MAYSNIKARIANNFSKAARSYDQAARLQRLVGDKLLTYLPKNTQPARMIDLGSGTGFYSQYLMARYPQTVLIPVDFACGMVRYARQRLLKTAQCIQGDAEQLPLPYGSVDGVFSNLMLQWCSHPMAALKEIRRILKPGGQAFITTLAKGSLHELSSAFPKDQRALRVNPHPTADAWYRAFQAAGFRVKRHHCQKTVLWYSSVYALFNELKALGANTVTAAQVQYLSYSRLRSLYRTYEHFRSAQGLPASYQVVYARLECR